ncbi:unnamed protein product [Trifolium pratense]|uniref:Uncharacterized protein n=1 Tax=Trifolium pratense TaxID=57577 RepID=A0ACB0LDY7_TRIPR|nr:unnamed protein product [Trifolium pratense]
MSKTLKFVSVINLVIFLFFITEVVAHTKIIDFPFGVIPTSVKCKSPKDCLSIIVPPNMIIAICMNGYCHI